MKMIGKGEESLSKRELDEHSMIGTKTQFEHGWEEKDPGINDKRETQCRI